MDRSGAPQRWRHRPYHGGVENPALAFRPGPGAVPDAPGCYPWRDRYGRVVYVGKAKSLKQRLANYFQGWHLIPPRTQAMLEAARSVEWIVVGGEVEALHLEYNLIKGTPAAVQRPLPPRQEVTCTWC